MTTLKNKEHEKNLQEIEKNIMRREISFLKRTLSNACIFCNEFPETEYENVLFDLPICVICNNRWKLLADVKFGNLEPKKDLEETTREWFTFRCFFCETDIKPSDDGSFRGSEVELGVSLCSSSCFSRYEITMGWQEMMEGMTGITKNRPKQQ